MKSTLYCKTSIVVWYGRIAHFTDGEREAVLRRVTKATRKLHPASDCIAGVMLPAIGIA
jgi:hypothetical protein